MTRAALPPAPALLGLVLACLAVAGQAQAVPVAPAWLAEVAATAAARRVQLRQVEADVVVGIDAPAWDGAGACEGRLVARRPGALRLRGYAAVMTVFDAVTDGTRFAVHLPGPNLMWVGPAGRESELIGLPVEPGTIVSALFGEPYGAAGVPRALEGRSGRWAVYDLTEGAEARVRFRRAPALPAEAELWQDGRRVARLAYHDYRKRHGLWWPTRIEFDGGAEQGRLTLDFTDVRFDHRPPDAAFLPPSTERATVIDLGADADSARAAAQ